MPSFYFDPIINPISAYKVQEKYKKNVKTEVFEIDDEELENIDFDPELKPFLDEEDLYTELTNSGIALLFAPIPFD